MRLVHSAYVNGLFHPIIQQHLTLSCELQRIGLRCQFIWQDNLGASGQHLLLLFDFCRRSSGHQKLEIL